MNHFKETVADIAVKDRLWSSTKNELVGFASKFAERHVVGNPRSNGQHNICAAAKGKGYRIVDVTKIGSRIRREMDYSDITQEYRAHLGLSV